MAESARDLLSEVRHCAIGAGKSMNARPARSTDMQARVAQAVKARSPAELEQVWADLKTGMAYLKTECIEVAERGNELWLRATLMPDWVEQEKYFAGTVEPLRIWRRTAAEEVAELKAVQLLVGKALKKFKDAGDEAQRQWDDLQVQLDATTSQVQGWHAELAPLLKAAQAACEQRDAAALAKARKAFETVWIKLDTAFCQADVAHASFASQHLKAGVSAAKAAKIKAELAAVKKSTLDKMAALWKEDSAAWQALGKLAIAPLDSKKAAAALELPAEQASALTEALSGDDSSRLKKLEALGKKLKHKLSGRDMLARLRKLQMA